MNPAPPPQNLKQNLVASSADLLVTKSQLDQVTRERDRALAQVAELQAAVASANAALRSREESSQALIATQATLARRESELRGVAERAARLEAGIEEATIAAAAERAEAQRIIDDLSAQVRLRGVVAKGELSCKTSPSSFAAGNGACCGSRLGGFSRSGPARRSCRSRTRGRNTARGRGVHSTALGDVQDAPGEQRVSAGGMSGGVAGVLLGCQYVA